MSWSLQQINGTQPTVPMAEQIRCAGAPMVGSSRALFACTFGNQLHFAYLDDGGAVLDCYYDGDVALPASQWNYQAITGAAGLFPDATQPADLPFVCAFGDELHFTYIDDGKHLQDLCFRGGDFTDIANWTPRQVNAGIINNAPSAESAPFVCSFQSQLHFAYFDQNNNIQDCFFDGAGSEDDPSHWHLQQINEGKVTTVSGESVACSGAPVAGSDLFVSTFENEQHFTYTDEQSNVQDCVYDGDSNTWQVRQLTGGSWPLSSPAPSGYPTGTPVFVRSFGSQLHFVYIDQNLRMQDWYFDSTKQPPESQWALQQIVSTGAPNLPGDSIVCPEAPPLMNTGWWFVCAHTNYLDTVQSNELHFVYLDVEGNIQDVYLVETSEFREWNLRQINGTYPMAQNESIVCSSAPKGLGPFVCGFGDELHYAYVDESRALQDVVWTPIDFPFPIHRPHFWGARL